LGYNIPSEFHSDWLAQQKLTAWALRSYPLNPVNLTLH
jgi:hypothetical protein